MEPKKTRQFKKNMLWYRLGLTPEVISYATDKEKEHAEALLRKRGEAHCAIMEFRFRRSQNPKGSYDPQFWVHHDKYRRADSSIRGLRATLRHRYQMSFGKGLYRVASSNVYGKRREGMYGEVGCGYLKKGALLMWVERDELGNNWFMDLSDNQTIITMKGATVQDIRPIPPEEEQ